MSAESETSLLLQDLQGLLQKSISKDVVVVMLVQKGENYGSMILKVDALVKKRNDSPAEEMHLVAKMMPDQEFQKLFKDSSLLISL
ncbi:hypothetical protein TSAR_012193 [Trichomalopsis sarcophagae]|uniref:Uncharacterized protein n=1 Tax=Trichomalopsis sarcophagae TaxID=543379 RepID=A0A232F7Y5_9HYME|nr:hypothetical protein TSAR_012193 [Trichomalopsis sarcophagae]